MNVTKPEKIGIGRKGAIIYSVIILVCIISLLVAFYVQFYIRIDLGKLIGINQEEKYGNKTDEEIEQIKADFLGIFNNNLENTEGSSNNGKRDDESKELVYTAYEKKETKPNSYDLEVHIPSINIKNDVISEYNKEIEETFVNMVDKVLKSENRNVIYTVEYTSNIQNGILSLMIHSNFKEGANAQKVIIKTYNYDLRNNKEVSLQEVLKFEDLNKDIIQQKINSTIEIEQKKVNDLEQLGYSIYNRDTKNEMYKIENTKEFYMTDNIIYIIYPYGNDSNTSEMDLVVL